MGGSVFYFLLYLEAEIVHLTFNQTELSKSNANTNHEEEKKNCEDEY